ncbi:MAG: hypothetical protein M1297_00775 [Nitrospirae bacterium]|jgi:NADH-quinone oxidoreductase subunit M|nr:hypothetical protein [Nitrospirota bacterium]
MSETSGKILEGLLLGSPLCGALVVKFFGQQKTLGKRAARAALMVMLLAAAFLVFFDRGQNGLSVPPLTGILMLVAVWVPSALLVGFEQKRGVTAGGLLGFLFLFFSAGFVLSPASSLALLFWWGILGASYLLFRVSYGSRPTGNLPFALPILLSGLLFPLAFFPSTRSFAPLAFLLFMPFFPFQRWMSFTPRTGSATVWIAVRTSLFVLSAWGIQRWTPLPFSAGTGAFDVFLGVCGLAQIQGALLALGEPVARKRVTAAIFSQMALCTPMLLMELPRHAGRAMVLLFSLLLPALVLGLLTDHLERETRRQNLSDMGGLFADMPRADRLFFLFVLMLSAMPGSGLFSGVLGSDTGPMDSILWAWGGMGIAGVILLQWALWQAWEQIFLGPPKTGALPVADLSFRSAGLLGLSLLTLLFLGIWPGIFDAILSNPGGVR